MTVTQFVALSGIIADTVDKGKLSIEAILNFLESNGADAAQLQANRALLVGDLSAIDAELERDGGATPT